MNATGVTAGPAESNDSLLPGLCRDSFHVTCRLTACTPGSAPGPTLGNEYGKTLPFFTSQNYRALGAPGQWHHNAERRRKCTRHTQQVPDAVDCADCINKFMTDYTATILTSAQFTPPHTHTHTPHTRSTQPCILPGSLNRVPASAGVRVGMSPLPGGR